MSKRNKLIQRFKSAPNDFTFDELIRILGYLGYTLDNKGNTSGSRVSFERDNHKIIFHKPHPGNIVKIGILKKIYAILKQKGAL